MLRTIVGKRGRGKTTLAKTLIRESDADKILILDFLGEYNDLQDDPRVQISRGYLYAFCKAAWDESEDGVKTLLVFDEIDSYPKDSNSLAFLYRYGRHANIEILGISRRFYDLQISGRALTDVFYLFQITEERDLTYLRRFQNEEYIQKLIHLDFYQYLQLTL